METGLLNLPPAQLGFTKITLPASIVGAKPKQKIEDQIKDQIKDHMQEEIENGCHQLETLLMDSADKTFDQFEIYLLRNLLTVEEGLSPWMRLGHYEVRPHADNLMLAPCALPEGLAGVFEQI